MYCHLSSMGHDCCLFVNDKQIIQKLNRNRVVSSEAKQEVGDEYSSVV